MKKITLIVLMILVAAASSFAIGFNDLDTPEVYKMTFVEFELRSSGGAWVTVKDDDSEVDLASVNPGALADAISGGTIPIGTYDKFRSTVSMFITIKGAVKVGTMLYYTTAASQAVAGPNPGDEPGQGCVYNTYDLTGAEAVANGITDAATFYAAIENGDIVVADYAECTIKPPTVPEEQSVEDFDTITVNEGTVVDQSITVNVNNGLHLLTHGGGSHLFPAPISIVVD